MQLWIYMGPWVCVGSFWEAFGSSYGLFMPPTDSWCQRALQKWCEGIGGGTVGHWAPCPRLNQKFYHYLTIWGWHGKIAAKSRWCPWLGGAVPPLVREGPTEVAWWGSGLREGSKVALTMLFSSFVNQKLVLEQLAELKEDHLRTSERSS